MTSPSISKFLSNGDLEKKIKELPDNEDTISLENVQKIKWMKGTITFVVGVAVVFAVWWIVAWWFNTYQAIAIYFPEPVETIQSLFDYLGGEQMFRSTIYGHLEASIMRWIVGYVIAVALGMLIGMAMGASSKLYDVGMVPVNVLNMIPGLAWIPVAFILFGLGNAPAVFIIAISAIPPIAINVASGIRNVPRVNVRTAQMIGVSKSKMFARVLLPYATVDIVNGLRIGMANAWRVLIAAEMVVGVALGLGYAIDQSVYMMDYVSAFVCIMVICVVGLFIDKVVFSKIEKYTRQKIGVEAAQ